MGYRSAKLTAQQQRSLEGDVYPVVPSLLTEAAIGQMTSRLEQLVRQTVAAWEAHPSPDIAEPGVVRAKPDLADPDFAPYRTIHCWRKPLLRCSGRTGMWPR